MHTENRTGNKREIAFFITATFIWTWSMWLGLAALAASGHASAGTGLFAALHVTGGLGPTIVAVICAARRPGPGTVRAFLRSWLPGRLTRESATVLLAVLAFMMVKPVAYRLGGFTDRLFVDNWITMLALFPAMIIGGGLEEPGWRGIVYDGSGALERGKPWAVAAMAAVWILWHLPLWFIPGTYQNLHMDFAAFTAGTAAFTMLFYAIRMSGASVGWCIVAHAASNTLTGAFVAVADLRIERLSALAQFVAAAALFAAYSGYRERKRGA